MKVFKAVATVTCFALMSAFFVTSARADARSRRTVITFNAPVEMPGVHLAGWGALAL